MAEVTLSPELARAIVARLGEAGQPPEAGIHHLNVGDESLLAVLQSEYLEPIARSGRGSSFKLVQGQFGAGKTHFLYCVRERAHRMGFLSAIVTLSPEECPFDAPERIYAAVARELCLPSPEDTAPTIRGIDACLRRILEERLRDCGGKAQPADAVRQSLINTMRQASVDSISYRIAIARFFVAALDSEDDACDLIASYLRGEEVPAVELRTVGIREEIRRDNAFRALRSLCQVMRALQAPGIVLAFDEGDRNLSFAARRRRAIADNLRQLIDLCGQESLPGLLCLYAVPPEFMTKVVPEYVALQQRLEAPAALSIRSPQAIVIDLEKLDLPHRDVLLGIGDRIAAIFQVARGVSLDGEIQRTNLRLLADAVITRSWTVAHRRAFVKAAVHVLTLQLAEPRLLDEGEVGKLLQLEAETAFASNAAEEGFADY